MISITFVSMHSLIDSIGSLVFLEGVLGWVGWLLGVEHFYLLALTILEHVKMLLV
jgi:hypothetical protein